MSRFMEGHDPASVIGRPTSVEGVVLEESFVAGKDPAVDCEDVIVLTAGHLAVIDGMSAPFAARSELRSGRAMALAVGRAIAQLDARVDGRTAVDRISAAVRSVDVTHSGPAGAVAAIYSIARREIWRVGDVHIRIGNAEMPGEKAVDVAMAGFRAAINAAVLAERSAGGDDVDAVARDIAEHDPGLAATRPLLELQPALANRPSDPFGYGVLNGTPVPDEYLEIVPVPSDTELVLCTDGYLSPASTLEAAEAALRAAVHKDPLALTHLMAMAKTMREGRAAPDDRAFIRARTAIDDDPANRSSAHVHHPHALEGDHP